LPSAEAEGLLRFHLLGALLSAVAVAIAGLGPLAEAVPAMLVLYGLALLPLCAIAASPKRHLDASLFGKSPLRVLLVVMFWAVLLRIPLLLVGPSLSDDLNRYTWEGRVVLSGADPYDLGPQSPELEELRKNASAPEWENINHPDLPAIYPPGAQWVFASIVAVTDSPTWMRIFFTCLDLLLVVFLWLLLRSTSADPRLVVLYAWHPLPAIEVASSGHFEPLAILPMVIGLWLWRCGPRGLAWPLWGLALATKFVGALPAAFALAGLLRERQLSRALRGLLMMLATAGVLALPFCLDGTLPLGSLAHYAQHWGNFAAFHALFAELIGYHPARILCGILLLLWGAWLALRSLEPARAFLGFFAGLLLLSPVVHPWYGLWLLVVLPLYPSLPLFLLSSLLPLAYLASAVQQGGAGPAPLWAPWLAYGLPVLLLMRQLWMARRT
jgi:alpha-1,6-mannosyltransferase